MILSSFVPKVRKAPKNINIHMWFKYIKRYSSAAEGMPTVSASEDCE